MDILFDLALWQGLLSTIAFFVIPGLTIIIIAKRFLNPYHNKKHEKVGRLLFRVSAGLIAFLISLSYANERVEVNKLKVSMEEESSLIVNTFIKLNIHDSPEAIEIRDKLVKYVNFILEDDWKNVNDNPFFSNASRTMVEVNMLAYELPEESIEQERVKSEIITEINQITKLMQIRIYANPAIIPFLIYILGLGLVFMWIFYTVYDLDLISLLYISMYNTLIAVLIYFTILLSNPLSGPMKIKAHSFDIIKTKGFDQIPKYTNP